MRSKLFSNQLFSPQRSTRSDHALNDTNNKTKGRNDGKDTLATNLTLIDKLFSLLLFNIPMEKNCARHLQQIIIKFTTRKYTKEIVDVILNGLTDPFVTLTRDCQTLSRQGYGNFFKENVFALEELLGQLLEVIRLDPDSSDFDTDHTQWTTFRGKISCNKGDIIGWHFFLMMATCRCQLCF